MNPSSTAKPMLHHAANSYLLRLSRCCEWIKQAEKERDLDFRL